MPRKNNSIIQNPETAELKMTCSLVDHIQDEEHKTLKSLIQKLCDEIKHDTDPQVSNIFILLDRVNTRIRLEKELLFPLIRRWLANREITLQSHKLLSRIMSSKYSNAWAQIQDECEKLTDGMGDSKYDKTIERLSAEITWYAKIENEKLIPTLKKLLGLDTQH